jgi:hypothetical protein
MKKILALGLFVPVGLAALVTFTSCGASSDDSNSMIAGLLGPKAVYLFDVGSPFDGDFDIDNNGDARSELDLLAANAYLAWAGRPDCSKVHAFISVSASDSIATMGIPDNVPIYGPNGTMLANNLADLLDGDIAVTLQTAGITVSNFWTGSNDSGQATSTCVGWRTNSNASLGAGGWSNVTTGWLNGGTPACDNTRGLLGVCW